MGVCLSVNVPARTSNKTRGLTLGRTKEPKRNRIKNETRAVPAATDRGAQQHGRPFRRIPDQYETIDEVTRELRKAGLESCQLLVGIDFTKSNEWTGERSFGGKH